MCASCAAHGRPALCAPRSYRAYWRSVLLEYLSQHKGSDVSFKDISKETGINTYDIVSTLQSLNMIKYWKGKHVVVLRPDLLEEHARKAPIWHQRALNPKYLRWAPLVVPP